MTIKLFLNEPQHEHLWDHLGLSKAYNRNFRYFSSDETLHILSVRDFKIKYDHNDNRLFTMTHAVLKTSKPNDYILFGRLHFEASPYAYGNFSSLEEAQTTLAALEMMRNQ